jgi:NADPH:quinone reductase
MTRTDPNMMNAIMINGGKGPATALQLEQGPIPAPRDGEILVKVHAAGVNRPDIFQRMGFYPPPAGASDILGLEIAGEVVQAAGRWKVGDRVCALLGGGGYAEYATCDARHALPIPAGLSMEEAASLPETVFTVYANVFADAGLKPGGTFMVHAATSGIGVTAIQMAKAAGATVIATARGAAKATAAQTLGADVIVDSTTEDFAEIATRHGGVDVILDMVGGAYFEKNLQALKCGGRIVFIASLGGNEVVVPVLQVMQKRAMITGSTLRGRDAGEKAQLAAEIERVVWPWIESGKVKPQIDRTFPLANAAAAHQRMEEGAHVGKIVLTVS